MNILSKHKHKEPLVTVMIKGSVLSVLPEHDELDTVNDRVMAVQCGVTKPPLTASHHDLGRGG